MFETQMNYVVDLVVKITNVSRNINSISYKLQFKKKIQPYSRSTYFQKEYQGGWDKGTDINLRPNRATKLTPKLKIKS